MKINSYFLFLSLMHVCLFLKKIKYKVGNCSTLFKRMLGLVLLVWVCVPNTFILIYFLAVGNL